MSTRIVELGYSRGKLHVVISKEYQQFFTCQKVGLLACSQGIRIRPGGKNATLGENNSERYPAWRFVYTRCQFRPPVDFAQVPVHVEELADGMLLAKWPEPDMIKPPRRSLHKRRGKLDYDTAHALVMELVKNDQSTFEAVMAMADDFIQCLEILRGEEQ